MPTLPETINKTVSREYSIARLSDDNLADVARLYLEVYGAEPASGYFLKKYDTLYTGVKNVGFIAYNDEQKPIAYYGVIPCFIQYGNEITLAAQSADTMTHPHYRNKGLFLDLSNMTFDLCRQMGILLVFGFPNQNAYPAMITKLGWIETERMRRFSIPVATTWRSNFFWNRKRYKEKTLNEFLLPEPGVSNSVVADGYAGVYRGEDYMQYKSFTNNAVLKISAGELWVKPGKELIIGDIMLRDKNKMNCIEEIISMAKKLHANKISFQACSNCSMYNMFASRYQSIVSFPVLFKDLGSGLPLMKIKFTFADIDIF